MEADIIEHIVCEVMRRIEKPQESGLTLILAQKQDVDPAYIKKFLHSTAELRYLDKEDTDSSTLLLKEYERVILPSLSCSDMADLAGGKASNDVAKIILSFLLRGQGVEVIDYEYQSYANSAPEALWNLYQSYEKTLAGFGLRSLSTVATQSQVLRKRLVTEQDMAQLVGTGTQQVTIAQGTLVTALAEDVAKAHQIKMIKQ